MILCYTTKTSSNIYTLSLHDALPIWIQKEVGITFIFVTHDQEEAMTISDRIAVMNKGRIEQLGPPEEVYERPATEFVAEIVDRKSTRLNSSHVAISYAVFCLKIKNNF